MFDYRPALVCCAAWVFCCVSAAAQISGLPAEQLPLVTMDVFRAPTPGWKIVGKAYARHPAAPLQTATGTGVLLFDGSASAGLTTKLEHGDLEIDLAFMLEEGACAGLLLQGRYELALCDDRDDGPPTGQHTGGILFGGSAGVPPQLDASRAPGIWQELSIDFRAPRFDRSGRKTASARFERVVLNGVVVQSAIEAPEPGPSAALEGAAERGPVVFYGKTGGVAFRNVRYKRYGEDPIRVHDVRYAYYEDGLEDETTRSETMPTHQGTASHVSSTYAMRNNHFALRFVGQLTVPKTGAYHFDALARGEVTMTVDGRPVLPPNDAPGGTIELAEGDHAFMIQYKKTRRGDPALSVYVEGPGMRRQPLTSSDGGWHPPAVAPIPVEPAGRPTVLRNYVHHDGRKKVNGVFVGDPTRVHYSLDLDQGALLYVWRGPFLNLGPVWTGRGMEPDSRLLDEPEIAGSRIAFSGKPTVAVLPDPDAAWPDTVDRSFRLLGYRLDAAGRPAFRYRLGAAEIEDRFEPDTQGTRLKREVALSGEAGSTLWIRLAEGKHIERRSARHYSIDDKFFIDVASDAEPVVRTSGGAEELIVPVRLSSEPARIVSTIIW